MNESIIYIIIVIGSACLCLDIYLGISLLITIKDTTDKLLRNQRIMVDDLMKMDRNIDSLAINGDLLVASGDKIKITDQQGDEFIGTISKG